MTRNVILLMVFTGLVYFFSACGDDEPGDNNNNHDAERCGNNVVEGDETCDGTDLIGHDCTTVGEGFTAGTLACRTDCTGFNTSGCLTGPGCGNSIREADEVCDGTDMGSDSCMARGYSGGRLRCSSKCDRVLVTDCYNGPGRCGNGVLEGFEDCDGQEPPMFECNFMGYESGTPICGGDCRWDVSGCEGDPCEIRGWYGDGWCDACVLLGGNPDPDCRNRCGVADGECVSYLDMIFRASTCLLAVGLEDPDCGTCGDGQLSAVEWCDGSDLGDRTCVYLGFLEGNLACDANCNYDTSGCKAAVCGDGVAEGMEVCDGEDVKGFECKTIGEPFTAGDLGCAGTCDGWNTERCEAPCITTDLGQWNGTTIVEHPDTCTGSWSYGNLVTNVCAPWMWAAYGPEVLYALTLNPSDAVHIEAVPASGVDTLVYVLTDCLDFNVQSCLDISDAGGTDEIESLVLENTGADARTFFVVVETQEPCGQVALTIAPN